MHSYLKKTWLVPMMFLYSLPLIAHTSAQPFSTVISIPPDPDPRTIGSDTQLNLSAGGLIDAQFVAGDPDGTSHNIEVNISGGEMGSDSKGYNSTINISGGIVGKRLSIYNSTLNISGGEVVTDANTFADSSVIAYDSTINISGGIIGKQLSAYNSILNISGGEVGSNAKAFAGTVVNVSGGIAKDGFKAYVGSTININSGEVKSLYSFSEVNISDDALVRLLVANAGSTTNISGGTVGKDFDGTGPTPSIVAQWNSTFNISGGDVGSDIDTVAGSTINLIGSSFILDGIDLTPDLMPWETTRITTQDVTIEGFLADGSPFSFYIEKNTTVLPDAIWTITLVPEPCTLGLIGIGALTILRRREG